MFDSNITINDFAAEAKEFKQISIDSSGSVRMDDSTTVVAPRKMVIRHSVSTPKGATVPVDRHLLQFTTTKVDSLGAPQTAIVNLTIAVPRSEVIETTDVGHLLAFVANWMALSSNITSLSLGEY